MIQRVYVIRHGETEWSLSGQHTGNSDIPLTETGKAKAKALGRLLQGIAFAHVLTSPRQRARLTCELAGLGQNAVVDPDLAEWDYGDYEGKKTAEIHQLNPTWNLFRDGGPHGESPSAISARADRFIARVRQFEGNIALFGHGHFSRVVTVRWLSFPVLAAERFLLDTASFGVLGYEHDKEENPALERWNMNAELIRATGK